MTLLDNRIPPPLVCLLVGVSMWVAAQFAPVLVVDGGLRYALAGGVFLFGLIVGISAISSFRRAQTTINPVNLEAASSLVTGGIFRYTRNPMYVGFTCLLTAWAILLASPWTLLGPIFFVLFTTRFQIVPEERVMLSKFGDAYAAYRKRVRRWL